VCRCGKSIVGQYLKGVKMKSGNIEMLLACQARHLCFETFGFPLVGGKARREYHGVGDSASLVTSVEK
jgi:hypothetical protein